MTALHYTKKRQTGKTQFQTLCNVLSIFTITLFVDLDDVTSPRYGSQHVFLFVYIHTIGGSPWEVLKVCVRYKLSYLPQTDGRKSSPTADQTQRA